MIISTEVLDEAASCGVESLEDDVFKPVETADVPRAVDDIDAPVVEVESTTGTRDDVTSGGLKVDDAMSELLPIAVVDATSTELVAVGVDTADDDDG